MRAEDHRRGGKPSEVITEPLLAEVFGLHARVIPDPVSGTPLVVPIGTDTSEKIATGA